MSDRVWITCLMVNVIVFLIDIRFIEPMVAAAVHVTILVLLYAYMLRQILRIQLRW